MTVKKKEGRKRSTKKKVRKRTNISKVNKRILKTKQSIMFVD
jgi:hypothetical protein